MWKFHYKKKSIKVLKVKVLYAEKQYNDIIFTHTLLSGFNCFLYFISNCMYLLTKIALVYLGPDCLCRGATSSLKCCLMTSRMGFYPTDDVLLQ